jgi:hypothetical protein
MVERSFSDILSVSVDSNETKVFNSTTVGVLKALSPDGTVIFDTSQATIPGILSTTASQALTASYVNTLNQNVAISGNLSVTGTTYLNSVVINTASYSSGSTIFGDALSDTHQFTGSVFITGSSFTWNNSRVITSNVTSSMSVNSSSYAATASKITIVNETSSPIIYYPVFASNVSGPVALGADFLTYTYQPSTNILTVTASLALGVSASSISSDNSVLYGSSNVESINWNNRITNDTSNIKSINWNNRVLFDSSGNPSTDWENRALYDSSGADSVDWGNRRLKDGTGNISIAYEDRTLIANDGSTAVLDYSNIAGVTVNGALSVLTPSPSSENTLTLGPSPAGGTGEGGQIGLEASGGIYTSASFLDTWQDQFRILKGSNGGSTAGLMYMNLQSGNTQFVGAITASAYNGLPNDYLYVTRNTNQTIGSGTWADRDIIFNNSVVSKGISYNTGTGLATLTGGKVYRITARLAWSAAASYLLQYSCYNSSNSQLGPTVEIVQSTNLSNNISDGTLDFIYAPGSNVDIKIRTTSGTSALSGEFIRGDLNTQLIIQQIA